MDDLDRRGLLRAACAGCAALGLAACGGESAAARTPTTARGSEAAGPSGSTALAKLTDIPVGGSASARGPAGQPILLARPTATTVVAFSARCTHQGCTVEPSGSRLGCPCHDSVYDAFTGKVLSGPAPAPLPPFAVRISGADVVPA